MRATSDQTLLEHSERMAKQEERVNTHQAKYESALDRLQADMAKRDMRHDAEMARRDAEAERREVQRDADELKRDKNNTRWQIGMGIAFVLILGAWIRWPF